MLERDFQKGLIKRLKSEFPNCKVFKMDAGYKQGIPDLLILHKSNWAALEVKKDKEEMIKHPRPNQDYYVGELNGMSYASFIYPENKEEIINELHTLFGA